MKETRVEKSGEGIRFVTILFKKGDIVYVKTSSFEIMYETSDDIMEGDDIDPPPVTGSEVYRILRGKDPIGSFEPALTAELAHHIREEVTKKSPSYRWKRSVPSKELLELYERAVTI